MASPPADVVIITGMSGAGKSTTAKSLEDLDWYVIENLPPGLLPTMADLATRGNRTPPRIAAVIDLRSGRPVKAGGVALKAGPGASRSTRAALQAPLLLGRTT